MSKVRIVVDSTADIPADRREALGIEMVPLKVHFGDETYLDAVTMTAERFYERLAAAASLPTTSQPSPAGFLETFKALTAVPDTVVICLTLSSALSGTYQAAQLAKSMMDDQADLTIIDSRSASYGIGLLAVEAAEAARQGKSKDEIVALIQRLREQTVLYFVVDTLEYLHKGGRIGKASAVLGSLLNIKPILSIDEEGEVTSVDKVRGQKKAMSRIVELFKQSPLAGGDVGFVIAHANAAETAEDFGALLREHFRVQSLEYAPLGPVIGTHAGPGAIGIFMRPV